MANKALQWKLGFFRFMRQARLLNGNFLRLFQRKVDQGHDWRLDFFYKIIPAQVLVFPSQIHVIFSGQENSPTAIFLNFSNIGKRERWCIFWHLSGGVCNVCFPGVVGKQVFSGIYFMPNRVVPVFYSLDGYLVPLLRWI